MELRTIRYFLQLCKDLNFTVAASNLFVTQQALSKAILKFENELGIPLFIRGASGLALTEYGEYLRRTASPAVDSLDNALTEIQRMRYSQSVIVRFGCTYGIASTIQRLIEDFVVQYPETEIFWEEGTDFQCEKGLREGKYDIICITEPLESADTIPIYEESAVLVVSRGGFLDQDLTPEMLVDHVLIDGGSEFNAGLRLRAAFERRGLNLTMKATSLDKTAFINFVRKGQCALTIPQHESVNFVSKSKEMIVKALPFDKEEAAWRLCLDMGKNEPPAYEARRFANYLQLSFQKYFESAFDN